MVTSGAGLPAPTVSVPLDCGMIMSCCVSEVRYSSISSSISFPSPVSVSLDATLSGRNGSCFIKSVSLPIFISLGVISSGLIGSLLRSGIKCTFSSLPSAVSMLFCILEFVVSSYSSTVFMLYVFSTIPLALALELDRSSKGFDTWTAWSEIISPSIVVVAFTMFSIFAISIGSPDGRSLSLSLSCFTTGTWESLAFLCRGCISSSFNSPKKTARTTKMLPIKSGNTKNMTMV
mmetsp:Transcript_21704/g.33010  ORF Transcript_21704/g.33010 Transcript_21704/m.33010 type:complete len:233 (-) Transcript_21704:520-1218(-)